MNVEPYRRNSLVVSIVVIVHFVLMEAIHLWSSSGGMVVEMCWLKYVILLCYNYMRQCMLKDCYIHALKSEEWIAW